jgi:hypothetical protein
MQPWAVPLAAELHGRFGTDVDLTVGYFHYPECRHLSADGTERPRQPDALLPILPVEQLDASLDEPVVVASGHTERSILRLQNPQEMPVVVLTNGQVTARVLDPHSVEGVGGLSLPQKLPGVRFTIPPGQSQTIPLLVGTASTSEDLGYAIPAGQWAMDVPLVLEQGRDRTRYRSRSLPLTVTA